MSVTAAYFFAALCSWGVWEFGSLLWRMLATRQYEDSDARMTRADEHPGKFRLSVYLATAVVLAAVACAAWATVVIARRWL